MRGDVGANGVSTSSAARDGRIADGVDRRRDATGGRPGDALPQSLRIGHPDAAPEVGRKRSVGLRLDVIEEGGRARPERAVGETLLPADGGTAIRVGSQPSPAPMALLDRGCDRVVAHAGMDAHRQTPRVGQPSVRRERVGQRRIRRDATRVVAGDDAERDQVVPDLDDRAL